MGEIGVAMKDIYSPLEIDDQWDQRAPMVDDGTPTIADDIPAVVGATPHPAANTVPLQSAAPAPAISHIKTDDAGTNAPQMGQVFEPQYKPSEANAAASNSDDAAAAKMMGDDTTPVPEASDDDVNPAASDDKVQAEEADTTEMPVSPADKVDDKPAATIGSPEPASDEATTDEQPDDNGLTVTDDEDSTDTEPASTEEEGSEEVVEDVDKNVGQMIEKLEGESKRLDEQIADKTTQIQSLQKEIDTHNAKKAEVQKRIDGLRQVVSK